MKIDHHLLAVVLCLEAAALVASPIYVQAMAETPQDMLAAQIRSQGMSCDTPKSAVIDKRRSKPDHDVWTLACGNATYRVSRSPDMAAKIERLK
jgi:uncharacterized protein (DUF1800 family)